MIVGFPRDAEKVQRAERLSHVRSGSCRNLIGDQPCGIDMGPPFLIGYLFRRLEADDTGCSEKRLVTCTIGLAKARVTAVAWLLVLG